MSDANLIPDLRFPKYSTNWVKKPFGSIYSFKTTNSFSREMLNYEQGELKNIHYGDIHTKFNLLFDIVKENVPFINSDIKISGIAEENYVQTGDLVIADASEDYNDIGKSIEVVNLNGEKVLAGLHTLLARRKSNEMASGFAAFLMKTPKVRLEIKRIAQGSKVLGISTTRLVDIPLCIPHHSEQQKIALFLTTIEKRITLLTQKKLKLEQYKKGVMQKLFCKVVEFKDEDGKAFPKWKEKILGNEFEIIGGGTPETTKKEYWGGNIQWYTPTELNKKYVAESLRTISKLGLKKSSAKILPKGTLLFTSRATVGVISIARKECSTNQGFQSFLPNAKNEIEFLYYWILNNKKEFIRRSSGSTFLEISKSEIQKMIIFLPTKFEQQKIASFLSSIDMKIEKVAIQIEFSVEFKKGLLQKMFA